VAPRLRTYCSSWPGRALAITSAGGHSELQGDGADAAGSAGDQQGLTGLNVERLERVVGGDAGEPDHCGLLGADGCRDRGDGRGREGDLVGEGAGAGAQLGAGDNAGDAVADPEPFDVVADRGDRAHEVAAEDDRELVRQHVPHVAGDHGQVEAVDRRGLDLDQHLPGCRIGLRDVVQCGLGVAGGDAVRLHGCSLGGRGLVCEVRG
jgi:hypothetical protein